MNTANAPPAPRLVTELDGKFCSGQLEPGGSVTSLCAATYSESTSFFPITSPIQFEIAGAVEASTATSATTTARTSTARRYGGREPRPMRPSGACLVMLSNSESASTALAAIEGLA